MSLLSILESSIYGEENALLIIKSGAEMLEVAHRLRRSGERVPDALLSIMVVRALMVQAAAIIAGDEGEAREHTGIIHIIMGYHAENTSESERV